MAAEIRLLIADDHPIFRQGLRQIIEGDPQFLVVVEAGDGAQAMNQLPAFGAGIAILDIDMPHHDGFELVRAIRRNGWPVQVIFLTMHKDERFLNAALDLGVKGYVLKDSAIAEIVGCIKCVALGQEYVSPQLSSLLIRRIRGGSAQVGAPGLSMLSPTERQVFRLIAAYKTSKDIAAELHISVRTVEHHRANIGEKLGLKGSHAILRFAVEHKAEL